MIGAGLESVAIRDERGAGSALAIGLIASISTLIGLLTWASMPLVDGVRLQAEADQIALMAEDSLRGLTTGFPCELAEREAHRFGVRLDTCRILNSEAWIVLVSERPGVIVTARAHATS